MGDGAWKVTTGIDELDRLLFSDEDDGRHPSERRWGFSPGEVVLIRGEPGAGKTTLALQIASHLYATEQPRPIIRYVTLEEATDRLKGRQDSYPFCKPPFIEAVQWLSRADVEGMIDKTLAADLPVFLKKSLEDAEKSFTQYLTFPGAMALKLASAHAGAAFVNATLRKAFRWFLRRRFAGRRPGHPRLFVIDSLGALMNVLTKAFPDEKPRLLFNEFCRFLREDAAIGASTFAGQAKGKDAAVQGAVAPIILIIGEYHFSGADADRYFPESFFCDVEIVLRPEPLRVPKNSAAPEKISLGYHLAATVEQDAQHLETRSFCRVVKSRYSPNQSRRCAYDIVSGRGVRFYETYPGDGKLMLFAENEQQRAAWDSFFKRDLTDAYPALRCELFTMAGMETVYESSRRLLQVPLRTDMYLSSLDSYWVLGYRDYHLKTKINESLRRRMSKNWRERLGVPIGKQRSLSSTWVCRLYPRFVNELVHLSMCLSEKKIRQVTARELALAPRPGRKNRQNASDQRARENYRAIFRLRSEVVLSTERLKRHFNWLSKEVFRCPVETLLAQPDLLPPEDLRETFLRPLPRSRMTLFGQYNADLIPFLAREDMHQYYEGEDHWLCVPYDANIGLFVLRADALRRVWAEPGFHGRYERSFQELKDSELAALNAAKREVVLLTCAAGEGGSEKEVRAALEKAIVACEASKHGPHSRLPSELDELLAERLSWDQVVALSAAAGKPFGIETRSFDTLMATFLEMIWNCGGRMEVDGRYKIRGVNQVIVPLIRAFHYFRSLFAIVETPTDQTIDPTMFHDQPGGRSGYGDWLFSRYWYSSLIDALTATKPRAVEAAKQVPSRRTFVWRGDGSDAGESSGDKAESLVSETKPSETNSSETKPSERPNIEIVQMPQGAYEPVGHFTCSGEWSFALLAGSENVALACDLVSNLMGSLKVTERGRHGACLPTVNQFYKRHESEVCVPRTIRSDMDLPKMTFGELGEKYLGVSMGKSEADVKPADAGQAAEVAKDTGTSAAASASVKAVAPPPSPRGTGIFRQSIFDYRHCAREIFGELTKLTEPKQKAHDGKMCSEADRVVEACVNMIRGIDDLGGRYIFIRDPFRTDVATIAVQDFDGRELWSHKRAREPRLHVVGEFDSSIDGEAQQLEDLSPGGCCLRGKIEATTGSEVLVLIGEVERKGMVVPGTDRNTHIKFTVPFSNDAFGALLKEAAKELVKDSPRG